MPAKVTPRRPLGRIIRDSRSASGLSQAELATKLGVGQQAVSQWETGATMPSLKNLVAMSRVLDVEIDYFTDAVPA
jgi:transcriptional regulator with XRE-family HTH domain